MADPYFFGYGSLVNLDTHDFPNPEPAQITGWRREWRATDLRGIAFLTAVPDAQATIDGMIAHVPDNDWAALDAREWAYERLPATDAVAHPLPGPLDIAIYAVPEASFRPATDQHPILLSYLDVVVQGYLRAFDGAGVARFFETTTGWDTPVLNDRATPKYPRHQVLSAQETALVDHHLAAKQVRILMA